MDDMLSDCQVAFSVHSRLRNDLYCVEWDVKLYYTILCAQLTLWLIYKSSSVMVVVPKLEHCALAAAQYIVIGPLCGCVCVGWVCYHDNSKLCASILTNLGL